MDGLKRMHWLLRFLADRAAEAPETLLHGITLISNAESAPETVVLTEVHDTMKDLLLYTTPVKVNKLLVVNAPWYWSYLPSSLSAVVPFVGAAPDLDDIPIIVCSVEGLQDYVESDHLVEELGGNLKYEHEEWVKEVSNSLEAAPETKAVSPTKKPAIPSRLTSLTVHRRPSISPTTPTFPADAQVTFRSKSELKIDTRDSVELWESRVVEDGMTRNIQVSRSIHQKISPNEQTAVVIPTRRSSQHSDDGKGVSLDEKPIASTVILAAPPKPADPKPPASVVASAAAISLDSDDEEVPLQRISGAEKGKKSLLDNDSIQVPKELDPPKDKIESNLPSPVTPLPPPPPPPHLHLHPPMSNYLPQLPGQCVVTLSPNHHLSVPTPSLKRVKMRPLPIPPPQQIKPTSTPNPPKNPSKLVMMSLNLTQNPH
ncbi:hypothetical protein BC829DRAFT_230457 [Chytridium lagenaria]|nr:hypothetical protein BC829DRAFT_230457 [Chytridium lagenaria]